MNATALCEHRSCSLARRGRVGEQGRWGTDVILEACYAWYWAADVLAEAGAKVHLAQQLGNS